MCWSVSAPERGLNDYYMNYNIVDDVGGGQNSHSKGGEKRPILGKLRTNNSVHFNLLSIRFV